MLSRNDIIRILSENKHYIDEFILDAFIKNWKIEAIYEDENGIEYFDDMALEKVRSALCEKSELQQEACEVEIIEKSAHEPIAVQQEDVVSEESVVASYEEPAVDTSSKAEVVFDVPQHYTEPKTTVEQSMNNVTLNITNETLNVLAKTIAEKITGDISGYLKKTDMLEEALNMGSFKRDNEILSSKLKEVLDDNKILIRRIQELEQEKDLYLHVVANIYVKKPR